MARARGSATGSSGACLQPDVKSASPRAAVTRMVQRIGGMANLLQESLGRL